MFHQDLSPSPYFNQRYAEDRIQTLRAEMVAANGHTTRKTNKLRSKLAIGLATLVFVMSSLGATTATPTVASQADAQTAPVSHGSGCGVSQSVSTIKICH